MKPGALTKEYQKEMGFLAKLKHDNITNLIKPLLKAVYTKKNGTKLIRNAVVMTLASRGHFFNILKASVMINKVGFSEIITRAFFHQMVKVIEYCHA